MNNLLAIDIGNTRTKWGVHDGRSWLEQDFLETAQLSRFHDQIKNNKNFNIINMLYNDAMMCFSSENNLLRLVYRQKKADVYASAFYLYTEN